MLLVLRVSSRVPRLLGVGPDRDDVVDSRVVALVELAKAGDSEAFGQLYDAYVDTVHRYLFVRVGQRALAEDLTSETFLRALRRIDSFRGRARTSPRGSSRSPATSSPTT